MGRKKRKPRTYPIGIYIGRHDLDIAAWFNLIKDGNISFAKWIHAILVAEYMNIPVDIGTISQKAPILPPPSEPAAPKPVVSGFSFGSGAATEQKPEKRKTRKSVNPKNFKYGWNVKSPDGRYIYGSVISINISSPETIELIYQIWHNNREVSTYLKALIRSKLKVGDVERPPEEREYIRIRDLYILQASKTRFESDKIFYPEPGSYVVVSDHEPSKKKKEKKETISAGQQEVKPPIVVQPKPEPPMEPEPTPLPAAAQMPQEATQKLQDNEQGRGVQEPTPESPKESVAPEPPKKPQKKNPMLSYING